MIFIRLMLGNFCVFKFLEKVFDPIPQHVYIFLTFGTSALQRRVGRGYTTSGCESTGPQSVRCI